MSVKVVNIDCYSEVPQGYQYEIDAVKPLGAEFVFTKVQSEEDIVGACRGARVLLVEDSVTPITSRILARLDDVWLIAKYSIGYNDIDVDAATENGIVVTNGGDYCVEEVSDHAIALLMVCGRRICAMDRHVHSGGWRSPELGPPLRRVSALTLGLVAFGRIPHAVARKMSGFNMRILAADPYVSAETAAAQNVELVSLDRLLSESDLVSVHAPLNDDTRHMIGEPQLRMMKPSAYLVNTGRGPVVDEAALVRALREGLIAGAALDVTEVEPLPDDSPLRGMNNVVLTPHYAASSEESVVDMHRVVTECVGAVIRGYWPPFPVNPKVTPRVRLKPYHEMPGRRHPD